MVARIVFVFLIEKKLTLRQKLGVRIMDAGRIISGLHCSWTVEGVE